MNTDIYGFIYPLTDEQRHLYQERNRINRVFCRSQFNGGILPKIVIDRLEAIDKRLDEIKQQLGSSVIPRESKKGDNNCLNCKHFVSYKNIYEDDLEPHDCGLCGYPHGGRVDEHQVGETTICDMFEIPPPLT